mgnify:CR=1 FL=1|tara:strand:+ start:10709 stop:10918 length:210 start_codon:yes stop_codon:yes gene_type:complete
MIRIKEVGENYGSKRWIDVETPEEKKEMVAKIKEEGWKFYCNESGRGQSWNHYTHDDHDHFTVIQWIIC